jgi:lipoyl(octanoyl) transferase
MEYPKTDRLQRCEFAWLGQVEYVSAWRLQERLAAEIAAAKRPPTLVLLEHPPTYTMGRSGQASNLVWGEAERQAHGIALHWVDRGGDVTYHGPGQLVGYPLIPLGPVESDGRVPQADYVGYVRSLEAALIQTLAKFGLAAGQIPGLTGVWIQADVASRCPHCPPEARSRPSKIAAIGVKVDVHGITRHGFALNVATDRQHWEGIIACGLPDHPVVSLADVLWQPPDVPACADVFAEAFGDVIGYSMERTDIDIRALQAT